MGKIKAGKTLVDRAASTMAEVVTSVRRVTNIMGEIAAASDEQSKGVDQVQQAVTQMESDSTKRNFSGAGRRRSTVTGR